MTDDRRSDRLAYVGKLAGGLAHEIKNPLSTIMVNLDLLKEELEERDKDGNKMVLRKVETLKQETERLEEMLDEFLSVVRGPEIEVSPENVNEIVDDVLDFVAPELQKQSVEVRKSLDPDIPECELDRNLIKQVLLNVIINAKDAMSEGGELLVRTQGSSDSVRVSIADTGPGIPSSQIGRIWDPYFSTKKGGSGLGLPTARRIVEEHGGKMETHSEEGRGSIFTIILPVKEE